MSSQAPPDNNMDPNHHHHNDKDSSHGRPPSQMSRAQMKAVLNQFGPYQRRMLLLLMLPILGGGYSVMGVVITFFSPEHRCRVPGLANDTFAIQNEAHKMAVNLSVPMTSSDGEVSYSRCDVYKHRDDDSRLVGINATSHDVTEPCTSWVYDESEFEETIVTEFDLVCDNKGFRANANMMFMLGLLVGSPVTGALCDRFGRKKIFMVAVWLNMAVTLAMAFPVVTPMLLVYRFLAGYAGIFYYLALYVLSLEFMGPDRRAWSGSLMMIFYMIGPSLICLLSYLVRDWQWLQVINVIPFVFCLSYYWLLDESPRWLLTKGREQEAHEIILKVMKVNNIALPTSNDDADDTDVNSLSMEILPLRNDAATDLDDEDNDKQRIEEKSMTADALNQNNEKTEEAKRLRTKLVKEDEEDEDEEEQEIPQESFLKLFKYPNLIARTAIIFFNWSAISTTYYGLSLNVANLGGSLRVNFLLSSLVQLVSVSACWLLVGRLGRKRTHCAFMLLSGTSCLATTFSVMFGGTDLHWVTILLVMMGKMGISAAFSTIYLMSGELFPTVIRNLGMGCSSTIARAATALSPYIADLTVHVEGPLGVVLPLVIFGALALGAGLLALCLPETLHCTLPDTIEEAANFTKKQSKDPAHVQNGTTKANLSP